MLAALRPDSIRFFRIFSDPKLRPPILEEMMPDLQRVIASVAKTYSDATSPHLQFDELMGEGNLKLSEMITSGKLEQLRNRYDFFRYFKTGVNNHARSRVQRFRFTEKRTGQKPPPRDQRFQAKPVAPEADGEEEVPEYHKNVDLSLDDPELNLQVADRAVESHCEENEVDWGFSSVSEEYAILLTPVEKLVFHEMIFPSGHARCYAEVDAWRKTSHGKLAIKIKFEHMAEALGMTSELFEEAVLSIRTKIKAYRMLTSEQQTQKSRQNAILAQLKEVFGLQIPADIDAVVVRRLLTMAARDQIEKITPQLAEMLSEVGAKVPRMIGSGKLSCYSVLYQRNCRQCNICDLRNSCAVEAANLGLTKMVQSARLLGTRQPRSPSFLPKTAEEAAAPISNADELEIITHLDEVFQKADRDGKPYYFHRVGNENKRRYIFCVERVSPLRLRFCNPSEALKQRLVGKQKTWFPKEDASLSEVIALIDQHGRETFI